MKVTMNRRAFLRSVGLGAGAVVLSACGAAPTATPAPTATARIVEVTKVVEKPVTQVVEKQVTQIVEKPVTQIVEKQVTAVATPVQVGMRKLKGKLTVATQGVLPVPGAPATLKQQAWTTFLGQYKKLQPDVQVVIEDLPLTGGEVWCETKKNAKAFPDISYVGECNYFMPFPAEVAAGNVIATDFKGFVDEINPYTGRPWKEDWASDFIRVGRSEQQGAQGIWTCQTYVYSAFGIYVNWDILKEYGVTTWPTSRRALWDLCTKINAAKKYQAWDTIANVGVISNQFGVPFTMDVLQKLGVDMTTGASFAKTYADAVAEPASSQRFCDGTFWISKNKSFQEAVRQMKLYFDACGGAAFFDPARDGTGKAWLTGKAAFRLDGTGFVSSIAQAKKDGVWKGQNWDLQWFPRYTQDDLFDKTVKIWFEGYAWINASGGGDCWAPLPKVRASGADPNVDLIVRDFLQFASSPMGQLREVTQGNLPVNPVALLSADPALSAVLGFRPKVYDGIATPPTAPLKHQAYVSDPQQNLQAWWRGDITDFDTAIKRSDENATKELTRRLIGSLKQYGLSDLPAVCATWK